MSGPSPSRHGRWPALNLPAWAAVLSGLAVLGTVVVVGAVLRAEQRLDVMTALALAAGALAGLLLSSLNVAVAVQLVAAVRRLHADALARLQEPSRPVPDAGGRPWAVRSSGELLELARVLDALHLRVRVADDLGEQHRLAAATAGAGVSELLSGLVAAEEGARGQLAAELHDTVAQSLMIARGLLAGPRGAVDLVAVRDHVEDAEEQVRAVMARTRPPALREGDLAAAVSALRADLQARYAFEVHVDWPSVPAPLPLPAAVTLYRFWQEALLNVVKHADVDEAWLALQLTADEVIATVRDEGPGFEPELVRPDRGRHVGLDLLRERARLSGGRLEVDSRTGSGTVLRLCLPRAAGRAGSAAGRTGRAPGRTGRAPGRTAAVPAQRVGDEARVEVSVEVPRSA